MAEEEPRMPTKDEIRERAIQLWMADHVGEIRPLPEDEELKEGRVLKGPYAGMSYWEAARRDLMSRSEKRHMERMLAFYEQQVRELREALGRKVEVTPEEYEEIREQLREIRGKYRETRKKLRETAEKLEKVQKAYEEALLRPPERVEVAGLTEDDIRRLRNQFFADLSKAGIRVTTGIRAEFNHEIDVLREELKNIERERAYDLAKRRLDELVQQIVARERRRREERRRPPTVPTPLIPAVEVPVTPITGKPRPWGVWAPIILGGPTREEVEKYASQMRPIEPDERSTFLYWLRNIGI